MEEKPRIHIHLKLGFLIVAIAIVFVLFKVNIEKAINSPRFQENMSYIEKEAKILYSKYLQKPALYIWNNMASDLLHMGAKKLDIGNLGNPLIDQSKVDKVIKPDRINKYFGNTQEETVQQLSSPVEQN